MCFVMSAIKIKKKQLPIPTYCIFLHALVFMCLKLYRKDLLGVLLHILYISYSY